MDKQKWINEGGIFYPIPGYATIYTSPGSGVFQVFNDSVRHRLGLERIADAFEFGFKLYDLGCEDIFEKVTTTWFSEVFSTGNKNLGVIFNGLKGTGKTIAAKVLSNRLGLPVVVVSQPVEGLLEFVQSLCFECVILIDEAEKTFDDEREVLLKMIDGVYNDSRKLYLLTTNRLTVDENLIGRPGRIRYIKEFGNLSAKAVENYIEDNLEDKSRRKDVLELVDSLVISTIDILKAIVDEVNIHGEVPDGKMLNIPKADYHFDIVRFQGADGDRLAEIREYIIGRLAKGESVSRWLRKERRVTRNGQRTMESNETIVGDEFSCWLMRETIPSAHPRLMADQSIRDGVILTEPDEYGFFTLRRTYSDEDQLCCIVGDHGMPSLYRGRLAYCY